MAEHTMYILNLSGELTADSLLKLVQMLDHLKISFDYTGLDELKKETKIKGAEYVFFFIINKKIKFQYIFNFI